MPYYLAPSNKENMLLVSNVKFSVNTTYYYSEKYKELENEIEKINKKIISLIIILRDVSKAHKFYESQSNELEHLYLKLDELKDLLSKEAKKKKTRYDYEKPSRYSHTERNGTEVNQRYGDIIELPKDLALQLALGKEKVYLFENNKCKLIN